MIHARDDYNRIQDPSGKIPVDEPVFLLRAKDITAPDVLEYWANLQREHGGDLKLAELAEKHAEVMRKWQTTHEHKFADL